MPIVGTEHEIDGQKVQINIEMESAPSSKTPYGATRGSASEKVIESARDYFADGMSLARHCAASMVENMQELGTAVRPDEVELQLAIKLDAQAGAVLTKLGAEAQLQVKLKWTTKPKA
jgi:hypothetical protein